MFLIRLDNIAPLLNSTALLTQIADEADLKLSPSLFSIVASHHSSRFVAVLKMPHRFFAAYAVGQNHSSRFALHALHGAILEGSSSPSMTIHILDTINRLILRFENSNHQPETRHELNLSPPGEEEDLGKIDYGRFFCIDSGYFANIVTRLSVHQDETICVTVTASQVKFSAATEEIILTLQECIILGRDERDTTTQFLITFNPTSFFLELINNQVEKIWFFKTTDSRGVIRVHFYTYAYLIYFPHM